MTETWLHILCEGQTEDNFVRLILKPHLKEHFVLVKTINLLGSPTLKQLRDAVNSIFSQQRGRIYVSTMIDYYKQQLFPNEQLAGASGLDRVKHLEKNLTQEVNHPNFIPYVQLHEFEALLFTKIEKLAFAFPDKEIANQLLKLRIDVGNATPEEINDGETTAPSRRIQKYFREYKTSKQISGPLVAMQIGLSALRAACPHFNEWIKKLENLHT